MNIKEIAPKAYINGYPLVLMDATKKVGTAASRPIPAKGKAPVNQFCPLAFLPDHTFRDVVRPNVDTLYSIAWLDLRHEPVVLSVPDTGDRYYLMPMLDAWTNVFAAPGTRTTGNSVANFAITGPNWQGSLPAGVQHIEAPTNMVWIFGRTQVNGKDDLPAVSQLINQYKLAPLSAWGTDYTPPEVPVGPGVDISEPMAQVEQIDEFTFFKTLAELMVDNHPTANDAPLLDEIKVLGFEPGKFDPPTAVINELEGVKETALTQMKANSPKNGDRSERLAYSLEGHRHIWHRLSGPCHHCSNGVRGKPAPGCRISPKSRL
jgi:hypothetical protein